MKTGIELITEERQRQIDVEGWTEDHDDMYVDDELLNAAFTYMAWEPGEEDSVGLWPWKEEWFKPTTRLKNLEKAGALIAAEIDRLNRANGN